MDLLFGSRLPLVLVNYQQTDKKTDKQIDDLVTPIPIIRTFPYFSNILTIRLKIIFLLHKKLNNLKTLQPT